MSQQLIEKVCWEFIHVSVDKLGAEVHVTDPKFMELHGRLVSTAVLAQFEYHEYGLSEQDVVDGIYFMMQTFDIPPMLDIIKFSPTSDSLVWFEKALFELLHMAYVPVEYDSDQAKSFSEKLIKSF